MELIDREDHQKLYLQLYEIMRKKIHSNEWAVGSQIPTEEELCKTFNVSRATVRTAVLELVRQGFLKRQQGKGTFICKTILNEGLPMLTSLKETMLEDGLNVSAKVISRTAMPPDDELVRNLDITHDKHVTYIKKLFSVDNDPVLLKEIYVPYHICPPLLEEDLENNSLFELFEKKYGIKITHAKNSADITYVNENEGRLLNLSEGSPALISIQHLYSGETLIMYIRSIKIPDKVRCSLELERKAV
jgi:DNA-binding GntR family transcriptional regulator